MAERRLVFLLVWMYFQVYVGGERIYKREIPASKTHLHKSQPYNNEEPGFFSRIASWIFPFGGISSDSSDSVPSSSHQSSPHYLPPPKFSQNVKYLPAAHHKINQYPYLQTSTESSDCNPCNREPWIPLAGKSGKNTIIQFISPQENIDFLLDGLNPPPPIIRHSSSPTEYYGPPPLSALANQYKYPQSQVSLSLPNQYEPFEEHKISSQYGSTTHILPQYEHSLTSRVPPQSILLPLQYEQANNKLRPSVQYGPPNSNSYLNLLNPPPPSLLPKPPKFLYGPPAPLFRSKPSISTLTNFGVSNTKYRIKDHMVPPAIHISSLKNYQDIIGMEAPPVINNIPTTQLNPLKQYSNNPHNIQDILQPPVSQYPILEEDFPPNTRTPLAGHSSPDIYGIEQVPLSSGDNDDLAYPIAFPNLSIKPLVPIHNFINFKGTGGAEKVESIQILPSVPLGDYISSIEYPINVIQSPLVEVDLNNESELTKLINISNQSTTYRPVYSSPIPNSIQSGLFVNPSINTGNLNEEPIVVDDAHVAASSYNETYKSVGHTSKRDDIGDFITETQHLQALPLNGRENVDDDLTIIENGISHSSDIIITSDQNNNSLDTSEKNEILDNKNVSIQSEFTQPPMDYSQWTPSLSGLSMEISPPPLQSTWIAPISSTEVPPKKTKHVQIIIPYYNFNKTSHSFNNVWNSKKKKNSQVFPFKSIYDTDSYTTLLPVYKPPSSTDKSVWSDFINDLGISPPDRFPASPFKLQSTTKVYNIQDILGFQSQSHISQKLPFDILSLQKNINEWTQQAFAKTTEKLRSSHGVIQKLSPSKKIPQEYFSTVPYDYTTMKPLSQLPSDHETAGSVKNENFQDDIGNNLVLDYQTSITEQTTVTSNSELNSSEITTKHSIFTLTDDKSLWDILQTTFSPVTKEKVYIVTPAPTKITTFNPIAWSFPPQVENGTALVDKHLLYEHPKFSIRIEDNSTNSKGNRSSTTKVIYSEWPHKINNLQTSTSKPTSRHPLFGLMDDSVISPSYSENLKTLESGVYQGDNNSATQRSLMETTQDEKTTKIV